MIPLVFDLDGTLIDSAPDIRAAANAVLDTRGVAPLTLAETISFIGAGAPTFVARMRRARDLPEAEEGDLLAAFLAGYETDHALTAPYPQVLETLARLREAGHPLGLCTNKPIGPTHGVLKHFGLTPFFASVIGGDSLSVRKPDPAPLKAVFDALGGLGLYVGDSETDAATAEALGVPFLLFTKGYRKSAPEDLRPAAQFSDFGRLPEIVAEISARTR
ncbi:phosphoglycolate phosphatase [Litorisediminicola beolgyonensis]|uniref:phosphoglycolate phosphatase n=1 Tax=Litorisediminicola beolgyonensis TaxID=1173614 RepID=A0ABW3ZCH0_9RHOB